MKQPLLEAKKISKVFRSGLVQRAEKVALENFSLAVDPTQPTILSVVGESGSGKSTMARLLLGLEQPTSGAILYQGKELQRLTDTEKKQFRRDIQVVFQDPFGVFNSFYRIDHVLQVPIRKFNLASSPADARKLIDETLALVGLRPQETLGRYPHQLSGGQRQRVMVARALLLKPKIIIADEPVSMIDASLRATILDTLRSLNQELDISLVYITHDLTTAYQISSDIIVLYSGAVTEAGGVEKVVKSPQHPYTQLLVGSIPLPNPDLTWSDEPEPSILGQQAKPGIGCHFAPRCPHAFEPCLTLAPNLFRIHPHQAAACYLHQDRQVLPWEEMDTIFVKGPAPLAIPNKRAEKEVTSIHR